MYTGSYVFSGPVHVRLSLRPTRKAMPALSTFRSQDRSPLAPSIQSSICMNRRLGPSENGRRAKMVLFLGIFGFFRSRRFQCDFNTAKKYKIVALTQLRSYLRGLTFGCSRVYVHVSSILDSGAKHIIYHLSTHAKHFTHFSSIFEHFSVINFCSSFISDFRNHFLNFVDELNQISRCSFYSAHLIISCIPATPSCWCVGVRDEQVAPRQHFVTNEKVE